MELKTTRLIVFAKDMAKMTSFYSNVLGFRPIADADYSASEWISFDANGFQISLHKSFEDGGQPSGWNKIVFYVTDVASTREELIQRGATMEKLNVWGELIACDGIDPEGNRFQISNRA
jgi:catechol 2,3-dioxygenase-like lactoylglutathione lyase family enzyme